MKKIISLFLSIVMLLSITAGIDFSAYATVSGDYEYSVLDDGTAQINKYNGSATEIDIPSKFGHYRVTSIGDSAFYSCSNLTSITIPDGVTNIGHNAFRGCDSLTSITIPYGVTSIGNNAFYNCTSLTSITIPDGVTSIGTSAFRGTAYYNNENNWVNDVLYIDNYLIKAKDTISGSYSINANTKVIADNAFSGCGNLTSITIPDGVTSIGSVAFSGCGNLTSITIPDSVTSIGNSAFYYCMGLTNITIPDGVTRIGICTFSYCKGLTSIIIPDSVTSINEGAFSKCTSLTSVTLPESVTSIGNEAFDDCSGLEKIVIKNNNCDIIDYDTTIPEQAVIYGYAGSTAQAYAEKHGREFIAFPSVSVLGGSIRVTDAGLRFGFSYDEIQNADVEEYGFVYSYSNKDNIIIGDEGVKKVTAQKTQTQDNITKFNLVFINIPESAYEQEISASAYVKIDGQYYYSDTLHRSFSSVANAVLADETIDQSIKDKINDLLNKGV